MPNKYIELNNFKSVSALCEKHLTLGKHCWAAAVLLSYFHKNPFNEEKFIALKNQLLKIQSGQLPAICNNPHASYEIMKTFGFKCIPIATILQKTKNFSKPENINSSIEHFQFTQIILDEALKYGPIWLTLEIKPYYHDVVLHGYKDDKVIITDFCEVNKGIGERYIDLKTFNQRLFWDEPSNKYHSSSFDLEIASTLYTPLFYNDGGCQPDDIEKAIADHNAVHREYQKILLDTNNENLNDAELEKLSMRKRKLRSDPSFHTPIPSPSSSPSRSPSPQSVPNLGTETPAMLADASKTIIASFKPINAQSGSITPTWADIAKSSSPPSWAAIAGGQRVQKPSPKKPKLGSN